MPTTTGSHFSGRPPLLAPARFSEAMSVIDASEAKTVAAVLAALADPIRVRVLHLLTTGPMFVGQMCETLDVPPVNMSHHLSVMRNAGLLDDRKDGRRVVYSLRPDVFTPGTGKANLGTLRIGRHRLDLGVPDPGRTGRRAPGGGRG